MNAQAATREAIARTESTRIGKTEGVPTRTNFRSSVLAAATAIALAGCGEDDPFGGERQAERTATPTVPTRAAPSEVAEGTTRLSLAGRVTTLLGLAGVDIVPVSPATRTEDEIELPVVSGEIGVKPLAGELVHDGGIRFSGGGGSVEATDLRLDLRTGTATAEIEGKRVALLGARFEPARLSEDRQRVVLDAKDVTVADAAVAPLNAAIGVDVVPTGLTIGDLTIGARWP